MSEHHASQQNPDGSWTPVEPIGWQPGIDWEVYGKRGEQQTAIAYDGPREVARIIGRGLWFRARIARANRRLSRAVR